MRAPLDPNRLHTTEAAAHWDHHVDRFVGCQKCSLHENAQQYVFVRGDLPCTILFIGEAPGKDENAKGQPFVGQAGKRVLNPWIEESQQATRRYRFAIINTVACIPLHDISNDPAIVQLKIRQPDKTEMEACQPRFLDILDMAKPKGIVFLGKVAASRRKIVEKHYGVQAKMAANDQRCPPMLEVFHPAYALRHGCKGVPYKKPVLQIIDFIERNKI